MTEPLPGMPIPTTAYTSEVHAAAVALHDAECPDERCSATVIGGVYGYRVLRGERDPE